MNKIFLAALMSCFGLFANAQSSVFMNLRNAIYEQHPEVDLDDKLIAFNVWSVNDQASRMANKNFDRAARVYQRAILKGGRRGLVVVAVNLDDLVPEAAIIYSRDGNSFMVSMRALDVPSDELKAMKNAVYSSLGAEVYKNLPPDQIFSSINQLITR